MEDAAILVVGGGAIGGVTAAVLSGHVGRLTVLEPAAGHAALMRDPGLNARIDDEERVVALDVRGSAEELDGEVFDYALVTVKATHLEAAVSPLRDRGLVDTYVSLGNGMVQPRLAAVVGAERVIAGLVEYGATNLGPGRVARTSNGGITVGELDHVVRPRTRRLAAVLAPAGAIHVTDNVSGAIWSKLLVNSTFAVLGAVSGRATGAAVGDPDGLRAALALWREGCEVAEALGIRFEPVFGLDPRDLLEPVVGLDRAREQILAAIEGVRDTRASMLQDLERGVPTEVDVINGAVSENGAAAGVATPVNDHVVAAMHAIERGEQERGGAQLSAAAAVGPY